MKEGKSMHNNLFWGIFKRNSYLFFGNIKYRLIFVLLIQLILIESFLSSGSDWSFMTLLRGVTELSQISSFPFVWLFFIFSPFLIIGDSFQELVKKHYPLVSSVPLKIYLFIGFFLVSSIACTLPFLWLLLTLYKGVNLSYFFYLVITFIILTLFFSICTLFFENTLVQLMFFSLFILSVTKKGIPVLDRLMTCRFNSFNLLDLLSLLVIAVVAVLLLKQLSRIDFY
ncbi:hypothetical protein [Liquorilactobacillus nagelii]|uniref:hypothetical protein n=2 Tax=Liquorilactobacillus nagelii TaxID=82688 RepID=UPI0039ED4E37